MAKNAYDDEAIRRYLNFLSDPTTLRDADEITKLQSKVDAATDPVDRLKALGAVERAKEVDGGAAREDFIAVARDWADEHGVTADHFRAMGVPAADLAAAGFRVSGGRRGRATAAKRSRRVPVDDIKAKLGTVRSTFSVRDLEAASGGTNATVRKALAELVEEGKARKIGPDPDWSGRGRSPILYERT